MITYEFEVMEGGVTRFNDDGDAYIPIWGDQSNQVMVTYDHTGNN